MTKPAFSPPDGQSLLTLNETARPVRKPRLMPCGTLSRPHKGAACKVFLKRTRGSNTLLLRSLQAQQPGHPERAAARQRSRRGTFLRLANRPQRLIERAEAPRIS